MYRGQRVASSPQEGLIRIRTSHLQATWATSAHHNGAGCNGPSRCPEPGLRVSARLSATPPLRQLRSQAQSLVALFLLMNPNRFALLRDS